MEKKLTEDAQKDRDAFMFDLDGGNCSCHLSAPCTSCLHPGNPLNQDDDSFYEPMTSNEQNGWAGKAAIEVMDRMEKEVEHDATQWNGLFVWEASDADTVHQILKDKFIELCAAQELSLRKEWAGKIDKILWSWPPEIITSFNEAQKSAYRDVLRKKIFAIIEPDSIK